MSEKKESVAKSGALYMQLQRMAEAVMHNSSLVDDHRKTTSKFGGEFPVSEDPEVGRDLPAEQPSVMELLEKITSRLEKANREFAAVNKQASQYI